MSGERRVAVVLFNLGGPDRPESVRPFLYNLFSDRAIIALPWGFRQFVAWLIARRRAPIAQEIYRAIGGGSPIVANTMAQAEALEARLGPGFRCFVAMRYWNPRAVEAVRLVRDWDPGRVILLPLYPQYSSTTTGSSLADWRLACRADRFSVPTRAICCWPEEPGFIATLVETVRAALERVAAAGPVRVLFSAHGLPKRVVTAGDPYQIQVERTAAAIRAGLPDGTECVVCYQSRVGPLEWLGPSTESEIHRAGSDRVGLVVVPVAFVSEHSETLVELDIEYRRLAEACEVPFYERVGTVDTGAEFLEGLASMVRAELQEPAGTRPADHRVCAPAQRFCPCRVAVPA